MTVRARHQEPTDAQVERAIEQMLKVGVFGTRIDGDIEYDLKGDSVYVLEWRSMKPLPIKRRRILATLDWEWYCNVVRDVVATRRALRFLKG